MSEIKNPILSKETFSDAAGLLGIAVMTAAVTLSTLDFGSRPDNRAVLPTQPELAMAGEHNGNDPVSRERNNETAPHHVSYSETQRTPSRSGKQ